MRHSVFPKRASEMVLRIADRHGRMVALLPLVLTTVLEEDAAVHDFQLIQTGARKLHVALGAESPDAGERVHAALSAYFARNDISNVASRSTRLRRNTVRPAVSCGALFTRQRRSSGRTGRRTRRNETLY